ANTMRGSIEMKPEHNGDHSAQTADQADTGSSSAAGTPLGINSVYDYLLYGLSIPERTLKSTVAVVGGTLRESTALLLPQSFRDSKTYSVFVQQMLDFTVTNIGNVDLQEQTEGEDKDVENFVARKAVGGFMELASLPLLHVSPIAVLAIVNDVAYGSHAYLKELCNELKQEGVIAPDTTVEHAADLIRSLGHISGKTADSMDLPPLSADGIKETVQQTHEALKTIDPTKVIPSAEINRLWDEMHEIATREHVDIMDVSSTVAMYAMNKIGSLQKGTLSSIRVAGNMFDRHILNYYSDALDEINSRGYYETLSQNSRPYIEATWRNFSSEQVTWTEDLFSGRFLRRTFETARDWMGGSSE
ncbi:MAG: hypothetical protein N2C12_07350, partial [Planctomycetales bacterium]